MCKQFLVAVLCITMVHHAIAQRTKEVDIYLIGGQSNATGQGYMKNIPAEHRIDTSVQFFYAQYLGGGGKPMQWGPLCQASETPDKFGVELSMGTTLKELYPKRSIGIIKHALSGSNLYAQWAPGSHKADTGNFGPEFKKFVATVDAALAQLKAQGLQPRLKGMVWVQGEADARDNAAEGAAMNYGVNMQRFIQRVREQWGVEHMPFIYASVIPVPLPRFTHREAVRQAQRHIDQNSGHPLAVKNAFLIGTDDLQLRADEPNSPLPEDKVHFSTLGIWELGKRFAEKLKKGK